VSNSFRVKGFFKNPFKPFPYLALSKKSPNPRLNPGIEISLLYPFKALGGWPLLVYSGNCPMAGGSISEHWKLEDYGNFS